MTNPDVAVSPFSLSFNDYIRMFPSPWLFDHFLESRADSRKILSSNALADRVAIFSEPAALQHRFGELSEEEKRLCSLAYLCGNSGLPAPEKNDYFSDPAVLSFLVYIGRDAGGTARYFGFSGFEPSLRLLMVETLLQTRQEATADTAAASFRSGYCLSDITAVTVLAHQGLLEKKKLGGLTKNSLSKIGKLIHESYPGFTVQDRAECIIRYAEHCGIIVEDETGFRCREAEAILWLGRSSDSRTRDLNAFVANFSGGWCSDLLAELLRQAGDFRLPIAVFPEEARHEALKTLLTLQWAGIIECAGAGGSLLFGAVRSIPEPRTDATVDLEQPPTPSLIRTIMVLPDFTAVLPQETPPEQLYRFGHVGMLHSLDRVYKGAIHRSTLNDSLARGTEAATILAWLAEWNTPANVVETLREWIREYYRLYIADEPVLVSCDEKVTGEIASYEPLAGLIERVPAVAVFRIKPGAGESVRQVLSSMGYDYRMPTVEPPAAGHVRKPAARPDSARVFEPVVFGSGRPAENAMLRGKKYGSGLKALDLNETMHIIDYAILTGHELTIEYGGSPLIKKGLYTFFPTAISGSAEPMLDGNDAGGKTRQFTIRKIVRIGVGRP